MRSLACNLGVVHVFALCPPTAASSPEEPALGLALKDFLAAALPGPLAAAGARRPAAAAAVRDRPPVQRRPEPRGVHRRTLQLALAASRAGLQLTLLFGRQDERLQVLEAQVVLNALHDPLRGAQVVGLLLVLAFALQDPASILPGALHRKPVCVRRRERFRCGQPAALADFLVPSVGVLLQMPVRISCLGQPVAVELHLPTILLFKAHQQLHMHEAARAAHHLQLEVHGISLGGFPLQERGASAGAVRHHHRREDKAVGAVRQTMGYVHHFPQLPDLEKVLHVELHTFRRRAQ
mmetsp:Transcript_94219/g.270144  ORF Transcript_94219/g.270144 Transcript_94219/m.270144 type:complete len:294 (+) Transcript_94219:525-1406(+)